MKFTYLLVVLFTLSSCVKDTTSVHEKNTPVVAEDSNTYSAINTKITPSTERNVFQNSPEYLAKNEGELSELDSETAYEMCERALTDYYKAVWNGLDIELDTFIDNDNLKQYTQKKIQSQYDVYKNFTKNSVQDIDIGAWEVKYTDDVNGGFLYLKLPVEINKSVGSYGEVTEFLVRNVNGKLVLVDWYTGAKDSYDFMVRGENLTIDNPNIWNDSE
ncbi:hypothetical protein F7731_12380 [Cytobacillus depressus]|uniref:Uncharacterized protein n=1 Tax=Cytobacillus depressus TaxID=1602942 RepID=A0A6L3V7Q7_9BACI|nr:hypothetical protein [Cytobacillus depressus]KAB2336280.1 hypothetical protein F7731_12380 [Cytobacillus depressus]